MAARSARKAVVINAIDIVMMPAKRKYCTPKEIGIRKILGASISNIIVKVSKDFVFLLALANVVAWPIAYFVMSGMLNNYAYRTNFPIWVFVVSGLIALTIALFTISIKIVRAACANPADSLRDE